ncbi:MAG: hypothetical protein ABIV13_01755, partial [Fimbriimonadales bacterium]
MRYLSLACVICAPAAAVMLGGQEPTYDDVGPIVERSCTPCHSPGGPAPFSLRTYDEARRRAERIGINVASMAMPPCQIESDFGSFSSIPGLSIDEVVAIRRWATSGAAAASEPRQAPVEPKFSWRLGLPHATVQSGSILVPAEGGIHWLFAKVMVPRGGVIRGLQVKPSDVRTVRQATVGWSVAGVSESRTGSTTLPSSVQPIGSWAYGYFVWRTPKETGIRVPAGAELHVMLQCQAIGKPGDGSFELGLYYEDSAVEVKSLALEKAGFTIDVGEKPTYRIERVLEGDVAVTAVFPEFRFACERVRLTAVLPTGESKSLFSGRWDVYWTGAYNFITPVDLPSGTRLVLEALYNNGFEATHGPDVRVPIKNGTGLDD